MTAATHRFAHEAMGCLFELWIADQPNAYARGAARAAFERVDEIEAALSCYRADSCVGRINHAAPGRAVPVGQEALTCLLVARQIWQATGGAFDPTVAPAVRIQGGDPHADVSDLAGRVGLENLHVDPQARTVTCARAGVEVDLGGIGKGFAVDQALARLGPWEIDNACLAAGSSSIRATGNGPDGDGWPIGLADPTSGTRYGWAMLVQTSLSISGLARQGAHIVDPATLTAAVRRSHTWATGPEAMRTDALATAFCCLDRDRIERICATWPRYAAAVDPGRTLETIGPFPEIRKRPRL